MSWTIQDIPDQTGRLAVVTGATAGLGLETARALAGRGAQVVLAARDEGKAQSLAAGLGGGARAMRLDLADLASVEGFAAALAQEGRPVDVLVNNAGVMAPPDRLTTHDGFELQFSTNHLGHFALTARLLPLLRAASAARVVTVASLAANGGRIAFDDLQGARSYDGWRAYSASKLANLLFHRELQRRAETQAWGLRAVAAHPGWSRTELTQPRGGARANPSFALFGWAAPLLGQSAADGARPQLFAATSPDAGPGRYYGPANLGGMRGPPVPVAMPTAARDDAVAARLWEVSEALTGVRWG